MVSSRVTGCRRSARRKSQLSSLGLLRSKMFSLWISIRPITAPERSSSASEGMRCVASATGMRRRGGLGRREEQGAARNGARESVRMPRRILQRRELRRAASWYR